MNRKHRRKQLRNKMNQSENRHKASLQKVQNTQQLLGSNNPQQHEQKTTTTPEQILQYVEQKIKETETRIDERRSQFVTANLNYFTSVAAQLLAAGWNEDGESTWEERFEVVLDVAFRFTEAARKKSDETIPYFAEKFEVPPPLQDTLQQLIDIQHKTVNEIEERNKMKQEAEKQKEKYEDDLRKDRQEELLKTPILENNTAEDD